MHFHECRLSSEYNTWVTQNKINVITDGNCAKWQWILKTICPYEAVTGTYAWIGIAAFYVERKVSQDDCQ